ncbi:TPM domain-containing protein [Dokdonia sp.]|uniref:TPM domain-containing protein n=1 Tax=Dokdonia sp. TaxID=2024995 RepID=UPI003264CDD0
MKKVLKILGITVVVIYFIGNVLPNLIGVPLAAYHSYKMWNESGIPASEFTSESNFNTKFPKSTGIINDFSRVFTASQRNELSKILHDYNVETTKQIVVVTVDSISPYEDIQKFGTDLANEWGVGSKEKNNGLVIVLCNPIREIGISTGTGTEQILTDEICKRVIDHTMVPEFKNENYYDGIKKGIAELMIEWE